MYPASLLRDLVVAITKGIDGCVGSTVQGNIPMELKGVTGVFALTEILLEYVSPGLCRSLDQ